MQVLLLLLLVLRQRAGGYDLALVFHLLVHLGRTVDNHHRLRKVRVQERGGSEHVPIVGVEVRYGLQHVTSPASVLVRLVLLKLLILLL